MGKKSKTPDSPDYSSLATQQADLANANWKTQLQANRPNQTNQFGSSTWEQDPTTGQWAQSTKLNDQQQGIFDQQQTNQGLLGGLTGQAINGYDTSQVDFSSLGAMPQVGGYNQQAIDTQRALQAPQLAQQRASQEAKLAAMGLNTGSGRAWENAQRAIGTNESTADLQAIMSGINQGNTEYSQALQGRQQGVNEILGQKQANLGQLQGLMGLNQSMGVPQFDNFTAAGQLTTPDLTGAANSQYKSDLNKTNAANADKANTMKGIGTVASIAASVF
jgi:hypothetical protein